jgi:hypothetical protein
LSDEGLIPSIEQLKEQIMPVEKVKEIFALYNSAVD